MNRAERTDKEAIEIMQAIRNVPLENFPLTDEARELLNFLNNAEKKHMKK